MSRRRRGAGAVAGGRGAGRGAGRDGRAGGDDRRCAAGDRCGTRARWTPRPRRRSRPSRRAGSPGQAAGMTWTAAQRGASPARATRAPGRTRRPQGRNVLVDPGAMPPQPLPSGSRVIARRSQPPAATPRRTPRRTPGRTAGAAAAGGPVGGRRGRPPRRRPSGRCTARSPERLARIELLREACVDEVVCLVPAGATAAGLGPLAELCRRVAEAAAAEPRGSQPRGASGAAGGEPPRLRGGRCRRLVDRTRDAGGDGRAAPGPAERRGCGGDLVAQLPASAAPRWRRCGAGRRRASGRSRNPAGRIRPRTASARRWRTCRPTSSTRPRALPRGRGGRALGRRRRHRPRLLAPRRPHGRAVQVGPVPPGRAAVPHRTAGAPGARTGRWSCWGAGRRTP